MASQPTLPQVLVLSALSVVIATLIHGLIVMFAASLKPFLTDPARTRSTRRIMALLLVGVAVWFGLTSG
jgi:threonine/homoserine/homoserine lactone efflux protein